MKVYRSSTNTPRLLLLVDCSSTNVVIGSGITDAGAYSLSVLTALKYMNLSYEETLEGAITDAGVQLPTGLVY